MTWLVQANHTPGPVEAEGVGSCLNVERHVLLTCTPYAAVTLAVPLWP